MCSAAREERTSRAGGDGWKCRERAHSDEDRGYRCHHLGVLVGEEFKGLTGVDEPCGYLSDGGDGLRITNEKKSTISRKSSLL